MKKLEQFALFLNFALLSRAACSQTTTASTAPQSIFAKCLPAGIKATDVVEVTNAVSSNVQHARLKVTVAEKLTALKATCNKENTLVDENGKQIVFYRLVGCWGNPPPDYQELLQKQREEIEKLKKEFTVIEITCNPSGAAIP